MIARVVVQGKASAAVLATGQRTKREKQEHEARSLPEKTRAFIPPQTNEPKTQGLRMPVYGAYGECARAWLNIHIGTCKTRTRTNTIPYGTEASAAG